MPDGMFDPVKNEYIERPTQSISEASEVAKTTSNDNLSQANSIDAETLKAAQDMLSFSSVTRVDEVKAEASQKKPAESLESKERRPKPESSEQRQNPAVNPQKVGSPKVAKTSKDGQDLTSDERKPIRVGAIGKMKKREPNATRPLVRMSRPPIEASPELRDQDPRERQRSRSPLHPTNDDRERDYRDRDRQRSRSPRRSNSPNRSQEQRRQKRPAAKRDPQAAEEERRAIIRRNEERDRLAREAAAVRNQYHRGSEVVRSHYNARPNQGREQRNASPIVNLRNFNNWIKSTLIRNFTESGNHVLDLGCGKGGDLMKWDKANVSSYTGIDLAEVSIEQARGRYRNMRHARFKAQFYAFDCFGKSVAQVLPPEQRRFDVVSMQFCLHYAYETEAKARQMLANVSASLPRGGKFLGTIPDSDAIIEHVSKLQSGEKEWGNDIYKVEFENQPPPGPDVVFRPPYGHKYTFYLKDAVDIVPEYVVPFEAFRALAEEYNLELLYKKGFHEVFEEYKDTFEGGALLDRMGVVRKDGSRGIEGDEREAAGFYAAFCFEKRGAK